METKVNLKEILEEIKEAVKNAAESQIESLSPYFFFEECIYPFYVDIDVDFCYTEIEDHPDLNCTQYIITGVEMMREVEVSLELMDDYLDDCEIGGVEPIELTEEIKLQFSRDIQAILDDAVKYAYFY